MKKSNIIEEMNNYYKERAPWHNEYMNYSTNREMEKFLKPIINDFELYISNKRALEIACGTGNWTEVLAKRAETVMATDVKDSVLQIAFSKKFVKNNVTLTNADAYSLKNVNGIFDCAFAADWWSHIPKSMIQKFIRNLHSKLENNAHVIIVDMHPRDNYSKSSYIDDEGNLIDRRKLPDGQEFDVVKNFPSEKELKTILKDSADAITYYDYPDLKRWMLLYSIKKE